MSRLEIFFVDAHVADKHHSRRRRLLFIWRWSSSLWVNASRQDWGWLNHFKMVTAGLLNTDFESIISLVDRIMITNPDAVFYTTYQERRFVKMIRRCNVTCWWTIFYVILSHPSSFCLIYCSTRRNISPYLDKYSMKAELIPSDKFLHPVHRAHGSCKVVEQKTVVLDNSDLTSVSSETIIRCKDTKTPPFSAQIKTVPLLTFDCMSLLKITRKN